MLMILDRRLQVLLDTERYARLEQAARRRGVSVAQVVREAIDLVAPSEELDRRTAAEFLLAAEPMPVNDWADMKEEIESRFDGAAE